MATSATLVFAGKSVAAPAISFLINKAFNYLNDYRKSEGMDEVKDRLLLAMPKIQAVFDVVNPEHIKEKSSSLEQWLWRFRDAFEEAENAIDELEYYELEEKDNDRKEKAKDRKVSDSGSSFAKVKRKVVKHVKHNSILDKTIKSLTHHGTFKRLRKALEGLGTAAADVPDFLALAGHLKEYTRQQEDVLNRDRETGSAITATEVFGRRKEKELVVGWLTKTLDEDAEIVVSTTRPSVISIVGHGGMGKTTLAQLICEDDGVTNHFDKVIWACISTSFDATTVITKILESANANTYEASQKILREKLNSVKFLLILDDVWEDKKDDQWGKLFAPLRTGKRGSKILLTTRMQSVADLAAGVMGGKRECLALQGLEEEDNKKLFKHHAFSSLNLQDNERLQAIGEEIATKLRGYPLVTKVVGAHLRGSMTFEHWSNFLHQGLEQFDGREEDIMKVLKLSYYHLPTELQTCFRYCSIFPQDYEFEKEELLDMWMSSGLISQAAGGADRLPYIAEQCLNRLTGKSFFDLRFRKDDLGMIDEESGYYVMHDLMHDLAKYVSSGECAEIVDVASLEKVERTVRHISVQDITSFPVEEIEKISHFKNLRTIFIRGYESEDIPRGYASEDILSTVEEVVHNSNSLRLVSTDLDHTSHFLSKHAKLKHLRYFKSAGDISPESICGIVKLYHLTTLSCYVHIPFPRKVQEQKSICGIVKDIGNLDRLRYLDLIGLDHLDLMGDLPVGRLTSLRYLDDYEVQRAEGYKISALKDLRGLRRLGLRGLENVANHQEAKDAKLKEKQYLNSLSLKWSGCDGAQSREDELILEQLEPHANIRELCISGYNGTRLPNWIANPSVKHLVKLEFRGCENLEQLPPLAEFLMLKHLRLCMLRRLEKIGQPLNVCGNGCIESPPPPSLRTLEVAVCPELRKFPLLPPSLVSLKIEMVGLTKLPRIDKPCGESTETKPPQLLRIRVRHCASLTSLEGSLLEQGQYMGALWELLIESCKQLESVSLPFEEMHGLTRLVILSCPNLRTLGDAGDKVLPSSLAKLTMVQCGDLELPPRVSWLGRKCNGGEALPTDPTADADNIRVSSKLPSMLAGWLKQRLLEQTQYMARPAHIRIAGCENLSSLGGLGVLPPRVDLNIRNCSKLAEVGSSHQIPPASGGKEEHLVVPSSPLQIRVLEIDLPSLLLVEPLKNLCHTQFLIIEDGSEMECLSEFWLQQNRASLTSLIIDNAESLESLPLPSSSLEELFLFDAGRLRSIPDLPPSLRRLWISGCDSELEKKSKEYGGPVWNKISHIPRVVIGNVYFIMGKECIEETFSSDGLNHQAYGYPQEMYFLGVANRDTRVSLFKIPI